MNSSQGGIRTIASNQKTLIYLNDVKFESDHSYIAQQCYYYYFSSDESDNYIKYETDSQGHTDSESMKFSQFNFSKNDIFKCVILWPA